MRLGQRNRTSNLRQDALQCKLSLIDKFEDHWLRLLRGCWIFDLESMLQWSYTSMKALKCDSTRRVRSTVLLLLVCQPGSLTSFYWLDFQVPKDKDFKLIFNVNCKISNDEQQKKHLVCSLPKAIVTGRYGIASTPSQAFIDPPHPRPHRQTPHWDSWLWLVPPAAATSAGRAIFSILCQLLV